LDLFLKIISFGGTAILTFMGAYVTVYPLTKKSQKKKWWITGFVIAGLSTGASGLTLSDRSDAALREMLTGGDHYCFYRAEFVEPKNLSAKAPLWVICDGPLYNLSVWFSPADATGPNDPRYWSMRSGQHFDEIIAGGFRSGVALGVGKYRIEMSARNGSVTEILDIKESDGALVQSVEVFRPPGGKIYAE
jgi:hypothetical protein